MAPAVAIAMLWTIDPVNGPDLEDRRRDEAADQATDDPQDHHHQQPFAGTHHHVGQEAGDRTNHDP